MPNPDAKNTDSKLGNAPPVFKRPAPAPAAPVNERTKDWAGLPGKTGPDRTAGVRKLKIYPSSEGI